MPLQSDSAIRLLSSLACSPVVGTNALVLVLTHADGSTTHVTNVYIDPSSDLITSYAESTHYPN